jgi:hypothetical protein
MRSDTRGRGALCAGRSQIERTGGRHRRENAGMSSERHARNMPVESPRFPGEGSSTQGKSGPKPRTEVVGDGQQVEIPAPPRNEAVTQKDNSSRVMVNSVQATRLGYSEVRTPVS